MSNTQKMAKWTSHTKEKRLTLAEHKGLGPEPQGMQPKSSRTLPTDPLPASAFQTTKPIVFQLYLLRYSSTTEYVAKKL